jgi:hypothetical protein
MLGHFYGKRFGSKIAIFDGTDSVPKRRHIKFRRRGITQKKTYNNEIKNIQHSEHGESLKSRKTSFFKEP